MFPPQGIAALLKEALVVYKGTTTADGADASELICEDLAAKADWDGNQIIITSGTYAGQARDINGKTNNATGTVTPATAFGGVIVTGVTFVITGIRTVPAEVAALQADVGNASASTLGSLYAILGNPSASLATSILDGIDARTNNANLNALLGVPDGSGKSIAGNIGDYQAQSNLTTLLAALGIPDTTGKSLYTCLVTDRLDNATYGLSALETLVDDLETRLTATRAGYLDILNSDSKYILSTALTAPTVNSLTKFIASGGTALGTTLGASKSLIDAIGADGVDALSHDFSEAGLMQYAHGLHFTTYILFVIPEAVASISTHNTAIKTSLEKLGRVLTITQADALSYPDFNAYTLCVLGSNNGTAWTTSNLAHLKELTDMPIVCCDSAAAAYLEMGTANVNVTTTKALFGVANIEGSIVGMGLHGRTGLVVGTQDIADANTTFASLDMSDADITEVYYGYETSDDNAHVLLGKIRFIQPDGTLGVDEEGEEIPGSRYFYGPAYCFNDLNTLGQDVFEILVLGLIHSKTIGHSIAISGEIRSLEKVLFGNLKNKFSNSNPLAKFIGTGGTGLGQPLPASTSLIDLLGNFTGPYNGAAQDDNVKASLDLAHTDLDSIIADIAALNDITAANVWETNISGYSGAGYAGTYLKTLYDDWLNGGRLDLILDNIETQTEERVAGKLQIATTTEDLNQTAGAKDLLTGTTQSVILEKLTIRMPTEAAGGSLTSISIQTDDVTPSVIINSTDGAVANLTSEAQLSWTGAIEIPVGTKIQLTIAGGAHGTTYTTTIVAQCRAVVAGGYLT